LGGGVLIAFFLDQSAECVTIVQSHGPIVLSGALSSE
jgi:hypothetical protein